MKKILFVITKSNWGGAQRYVYDLATNLPKGEFEVVVALGGTGASGAPKGLLATKLEEVHVPIVFINSFMRDISLMHEWRVFRELLQIYKKEKPDVVHLNSSKAGAIGALAARMAGVPNIIFTVHGWPFGEQRNFLMRIILRLISHATGILSNVTICICNKDLEQVRFMPGVHAVRIYNGIDLAMHFGSGEVIRQAFPAGAHITGTIGELNKNKNHIALIEKARFNPKLFVAIVGEGELRQHLEEKIWKYNLEKQVKLFGFMPAADVLKGFDTFALPSLKEGLPYVLLEARAAGLPIDASRVGGIGEILDAKDMQEFSLEKMLARTIELYKS